MLIIMTLVGIATNAAAYRNGFHDGVRWAIEGEGYPSKPGKSWWGWKELRRRVGRKENVR